MIGAITWMLPFVATFGKKGEISVRYEVHAAILKNPILAQTTGAAIKKLTKRGFLAYKPSVDDPRDDQIKDFTAPNRSRERHFQYLRRGSQRKSAPSTDSRLSDTSNRGDSEV